MRFIINVPWYARNSDIYRDLRTEYVKEEMRNCTRIHEGTPQSRQPSSLRTSRQHRRSKKTEKAETIRLCLMWM